MEMDNFGHFGRRSQVVRCHLELALVIGREGETQGPPKLILVALR